MKDYDYKHFFHVKNGVFYWEEKDLFDYKRNKLEGKRGYAIIKRDIPGKSPNQRAYYMKGIIKETCLNSECFAGWNEYEVHDYLLKSIRGKPKIVKLKDGYERTILSPPDFASFNKEKTSVYIEEVLAFLSYQHDIHPKPAEHYKYNKFEMK